MQPFCPSWHAPEVWSKHLIGGQAGEYDEKSELGNEF
jgi:hypothetical protein